MPPRSGFVAEDGKEYFYDVESKSWVLKEDSEGTADQVGERGQDLTPGKEDKVVGDGAAPAVAVEKGEGKNPEAEAKKKKKKKKKRKAFDPMKTPWIYITGLPADISEMELSEHFKKGGVIATDLSTGDLKIKIYRDKITNAVKVIREPFF